MGIFVELWKNTQKYQKIHAKYGKKCAFLIGHNFVGIILCSDYATRHNIMLHYASRHNIMLCDYAQYCACVRECEVKGLNLTIFFLDTGGSKRIWLC
jgi:hypothetical protein